MCLAIPGLVVSVEKNKAKVKYQGESRSVFVGDEKVKKGDYVMVQMGIIIKVLSKEEVKEYFKVWNS